MLISGFMGFLGAAGGGLPPSLYYTQSGQSIYLYDMLPLSGGGYAAAGYTSQNANDLLVMRLDDSGNVLWSVAHGNAGVHQSTPAGSCLAQDGDGNIHCVYYLDTYPNYCIAIAKHQLSDGTLLAHKKTPETTPGMGVGYFGQIVKATSGEILMQNTNGAPGGAPACDLGMLRYSASTLALNSQAHFKYSGIYYPGGERDDYRAINFLYYSDGTYLTSGRQEDPYNLYIAVTNMTSSDTINNQAKFGGISGGKIGKGSSDTSFVLVGHHWNNGSWSSPGPAAICVVTRSTMAISAQKKITTSLGSPVYIAECGKPVYVDGKYIVCIYINGYADLVIASFDTSLNLIAAKQIPASVIDYAYELKVLADNSLILVGYDNSGTKRGAVIKFTSALDHPSFVDQTGTFTVVSDSTCVSYSGVLYSVSRSRSNSDPGYSSSGVTITKATS